MLSDQLCDVYMNIKSAAELWEVLEHKFSASDAGRKLYVMEQYHDFRMVDNRSVVEWAHEFQLIVRELEQLEHALISLWRVALLPSFLRHGGTLPQL
jgi:transcription elongation factor GreA-like protein